MASIRITQFGGIATGISSTLIPSTTAQVAHNCLLRDGTLRPFRKWIIRTGSVAQGTPVEGKDGKLLSVPLGYCAKVQNPAYPPNTLLGALSTSLIIYTKGDIREAGVARPSVSGSISYSRQYLSDKPVNRLYAVSFVAKLSYIDEESVLTMLPNQDTRGIIYEGDLANISFSANPTSPGEASKITHVRLYRSISGMDNGESVGNSPDTEWHLIDEIPYPTMGATVNYLDGGSATTDPLDVYLADKNYAFDIPESLHNEGTIEVNRIRGVGIAKSGWAVVGTLFGDIAVSEKNAYHSWPTENYFKIPEFITDLVVSSDTAYIGTERNPYIMSLGLGEQGLQANIQPYLERYNCVPSTMEPTPSGAIYVSSLGVVALTQSGQQNLTQGFLQNIKHNKCLPYFKWSKATYAAYGRGRYFVFFGNPRELL